MKFYIPFLIIIFFIITANRLAFSNPYTDSLEKALTTANDTQKINILSSISFFYINKDIHLASDYAQKALEFALKCDNKRELSATFILIGNIAHRKADYEKAMHNYMQALEIAEEISSKTEISNACHNLGTMFQEKGDYAAALENLFRALTIREELKDSLNMARTFNNIGLVYYEQESYDKALYYYQKSMEIRLRANDLPGVALGYNNIGIVYYYVGDKEKVIEYFGKSLEIYEKIGDLRGQSLPLFNIAEIYEEQGRFSEALKYYLKSCKIDSLLDNKEGLATTFSVIGRIYGKLNNFQKAIYFQKEGIEIARKAEMLPALRDGNTEISTVYEKMGNYKLAYKHLSQAFDLQGRIFNDENARHQAEMQVKYETDKKDRELEILQKDKLLKELAYDRQKQVVKRQQMLIIGSGIGILIFGIFTFFLLRLMKEKKLAFQHLEQQYAEINIFKEELQTSLEKNTEQRNELEIAFSRIQEASKAREIFLANTSHEIRTPLNVIIGFTNLLLKSDLNPQQRNYIENIHNSGDNLLVIINDLLTLSKLEAEKLILEEIDFALKNSVKKLIVGLEVKSREKKQNLSLNIDPEVPEFVKGDPVRLNQILQNLVDNAIKFTPANGNVDIKVEVAAVNGPVNLIRFIVKDTGIGIPAEKKDKIFLSFTQADNDTTRKYGGTGLGLAIVKSLVIVHSGSIRLESIEGEGSIFTVEIPYKISETCTPETYSNNIRPGIANGKAKKVLLVEDNFLNTQLAIDTLKSFNNALIINHAENGQLALKMFAEEEYDIILMDIQMPVMDGYETTVKIRALNPPKNKIPILAMTAHAFKEEQDRCLQFGMDAYITKPFDPERLMREMNKLLELKNESQNLTDTVNTIENDFFNISILLKSYRNNTPKLVKLLEQFAINMPQQITDLKNAIVTGDTNQSRILSHSLKSNAAYLGAKELNVVFLKLENIFAGKENNANFTDLIAKVDDLWITTLNYTQAFIQANKEIEA